MWAVVVVLDEELSHLGRRAMFQVVAFELRSPTGGAPLSPTAPDCRATQRARLSVSVQAASAPPYGRDVCPGVGMLGVVSGSRNIGSAARPTVAAAGAATNPIPPIAVISRTWGRGPYSRPRPLGRPVSGSPGGSVTGLGSSASGVMTVMTFPREFLMRQ